MTPTASAPISGGTSRVRRCEAPIATNAATIGAAIQKSSRTASTRSRPKRRNTPATMPITIGIGTASIARRSHPDSPSASMRIPVAMNAPHLSYVEVIGAFIATGILMLALGLSGWVRRAMEAVPMPIVMGMVAGVFLRFGLDLVLAVRDDFWIAAPMVAAFVAIGASQRLTRLVPPLIGALAVGAITIAVTGRFEAAPQAVALAHPNFYAPAFSRRAMVELVVPLAITVLVVQNSPGITLLRSAR